VNFSSYGISLIAHFRLWPKSGEGKMGSKVIRKTLSITSGMMRAKRGHEISKQGFVFTSISDNLKSSSSIKS
jgi:hypothetical protein